MVLLRLIGAFGLWFIIYNTWPFSLVLGIGAIAVWIAMAVTKSSQRGRPTPAQRALATPWPAARPSLQKPKQRRAVMPSLPPTSIASAIDQLSPSIACRSGSLFYSGPSAFEGYRPLYILGLNPGGSPTAQVDETVERDVTEWRALTKPWSAYLDESWQGRPPGTHGMQPRMRHMFGQLGLDLCEVPASNVVFVRSANEAALSAEKATLLPQCWPVHDAVIRRLEVRLVLCLGGTAGRWVRDALGAHQLLDRFSEQNARGWTSEAHLTPDGRAVVSVTHPGRADWRNPAADPTPLVRAVLDRVA